MEAPITDWLQEAYELSDAPALEGVKTRATPKSTPVPKKKNATAARKTVAARKSKGR